MITVQTKKRTGAALFFAVALLTCTPAINAHMFSGSFTYVREKATLSNAALLAVFLGLLQFWTREGDNSPNEYNLDELLVGENVKANMWGLVKDGVIGHPGKKSVLKADENGVIEFSKSVKPRGLLGHLHANYKAFFSALGGVLFTKILLETYKTAPEGKFAETFLNNLTSRAKSLVKMSDLGTAAAFNLVK